MKDITAIIQEAVAKVDLKKPVTITEAANAILSEDINAGDTVAVIDDPTYSMAGAKGKSKGVSAKGSGFVDVELANGVTVPMQSSLLIKLK